MSWQSVEQGLLYDSDHAYALHLSFATRAFECAYRSHVEFYSHLEPRVKYGPRNYLLPTLCLSFQTIWSCYACVWSGEIGHHRWI